MSKRYGPGDRVLWRGQEGRVVDVSESGLHCVQLRESGDQIGTVAEYLTAIASPDAKRSMDTLRAKLIGDPLRHGVDTRNQVNQRHSDRHAPPSERNQGPPAGSTDG